MSLEIEAAAEQYILQMVRYWSDNLEDPDYEKGSVDSGGMHIPYRTETTPDGYRTFRRRGYDVYGAGMSAYGFRTK